MSTNELLRESIGWAAAGILLLTIMRQVYTQWQSESVEGVSHYLFIGQLIASTLFTIYSVLDGNWVYIVTNTAMLMTAIVGIGIYWRNARRSKGKQDKAGSGSDRETTGRRPAADDDDATIILVKPSRAAAGDGTAAATGR